MLFVPFVFSTSDPIRLAESLEPKMVGLAGERFVPDGSNVPVLGGLWTMQVQGAETASGRLAAARSVTPSSSARRQNS